MSSEELRTVINDVFKNLEDTNGINDNLRSNLGQIEKVLGKRVVGLTLCIVPLSAQ